MATFTLKNIPDPLYERLKMSARLHHRSITGEILACLERTVGTSLSPQDAIERVRQLRSAFRGRPVTLGELRRARESGRP